jgi:hypothetical protein
VGVYSRVGVSGCASDTVGCCDPSHREYAGAAGSEFDRLSCRSVGHILCLILLGALRCFSQHVLGRVPLPGRTCPHCYTVEDARLGATQTLTEVAEALVSNVDAPAGLRCNHPGKSEVVL